MTGTRKGIHVATIGSVEGGRQPSNHTLLPYPQAFVQRAAGVALLATPTLDKLSPTVKRGQALLRYVVMPQGGSS